MTRRTLYIPAKTSAGAESIASAIDAGRIDCPVAYLSPAEATLRAAAVSFSGREKYQVFEAPLVASPDGWVRVARLVDRIADIAAALLLVAVAPAVLAACWSALS